MRIDRLKLDGFGRFDRTIAHDFGPGLNVVLGPNESGKSTLREAIMAILLGFEDKAAEERHRPRGGKRFRGEIDISTVEARWTVQRDFDTHQVVVSRKKGNEATRLFEGDANPRGRTDDLAAYLDVIQGIIGFTDRGLGGRTFVVGQGGLETAIDETIRQIISGSQQGDYDTVLTRLEERFFSLTRDNPWSNRKKSRPREIEELGDRLAQIEGRLEKARASLRQGGALLTEMESSSENLVALRRSREEKDRLFESYREFFELNRERSELEKRLAVLRDEKEKVKGFEAECRRTEAGIGERLGHFHKAPPDFGEKLKNLGTLDRDIAALADEHKRRQAILAANTWSGQTKRNFIIAAIVTIVTSLAMWGAGVGWASLAIGLVVGVLSVVGLYLLGNRKERERMKMEASVLEMEDRLELQKGEMSRLEADVRPVIGSQRMTEALEEWREYRELADLLSRHEQIRDSHRPLAEVEGDYDDVFQKLKLADARARDLIAQSPYLANADQNLEDASLQVERLRREREALLADEQRETDRLEDLKLRRARQEGGQVDDAESLEDELAESRERLAALRFRRDAFRMAVDVLKECVTEFQEGHLERLAGDAGTHLARITAGRWTRVALDRNFVPRVVDAEGQTFEPEALSQGTRDQLHLSLRLALIDGIFGDAGPALVLDDALVHCDIERLATIRKMLEQEVARGRQVLLFSHDPAYAAWGATVIRLKGAAPALV
ncbi:MAG TPA: AAA family ATPase [Candidatus Eisenbacteria bacterium]